MRSYFSSRKNINNSLKRVTAAAAAAALCCLTGCAGTNSESVPMSSAVMAAVVSSSSSAVQSSAPTVSSSSASAPVSVPVSSSTEISSSSSAAYSAPHFSFPEGADMPIPSSANIEICSLSQALGAFDEVSSKKAEGTPDDIVKTLLERNILCFAAVQGSGWTSESSSGVVPVKSVYFKSADQMTDLFARTYTANQAWRLMHPQEPGGYGNVFTDGENGELMFDMYHLRKYHGDSFSSVTYAAVISASDDEIEFGRYYTNVPSGGTEPNNMFFKAVKENGEWVLENYITDADAWYQPARFIETGRVGAPELMTLAEKQVGNIGGKKFWSWYGFGEHMEWCAAFTSWCYGQAGKSEPFFTGCYSGAEWFKEREQWGEPDYADIAPGDCIFFDWNLDGDADHVGLVAGTDGAYVYTVEGNRDDVCIQRMYALSFQYIMGYGLMEWN